MAVEFNSPYFVKNEVIRKGAIKLRGVYAFSDLVVMGYNKDNEKLFIMAFLNPHIEFKDKIFEYIYERLQADIQNC